MIDKEYDHAVDSINSGLYVHLSLPDHLLEWAQEVRMLPTGKALQVLLRTPPRQPQQQSLRKKVQRQLSTVKMCLQTIRFRAFAT